VDPESVEVVDSSVVGMGNAAMAAVRQFEFEPGQKDGTAVKTLVVFPIQFTAPN
jgi:TonB family protein